MSVPVVEDRVVLAHEHVAEDPEGTHGLGHVHAHDGQDAHLVVPGVDHVLVPRQSVLLNTKRAGYGRVVVVSGINSTWGDGVIEGPGVGSVRHQPGLKASPASDLGYVRFC